MAAVASVQETAGYVLVVEDTDTIREAVIECLREEGIRAIGVENGACALEHLRSGAALPFAILTDLMMPVVDGWQLIRMLRADRELQSIRLVAMTASPLGAAPEGVPLLRKPFHFADMIGALTCR